MRVWTESTFKTAIELDPDSQDDTIWLTSRTESRRRHGVALLDRIDQAGHRVARVTALVGFGFVACATISNSALAPVSRAHAAVERFKLHPVYPAAVEHVTAPTGDDLETGAAVAPAPMAMAAAPAQMLRAARTPVLAATLADEAPNEIVGPAQAPIGDAPVLAVLQAEIQHPSFQEAREAVEEDLRFGSRELPRRLVDTIVRAAAATEVDPIYLMALADKESSFRTEVRASTSSAVGLFQFIDRTWLETVRAFGPKHGLATEAARIEVVEDKPVIADEAERTRILDLRRDPYVAAVMAAEMLRRDAAQIGFRIGRELNATEMYLAHFLGLDGAARFIAMRAKKKAQSATAAFPAAARANATIFFAPGKKGRRKGLSVPEVYARIDRMIDSRLELFRPVKVYAEIEPNG